MRQKIWIADFLIREKEEVSGYSTAVEAPDIKSAAETVEWFIEKTFRAAEYQIHTIEIADDANRRLLEIYWNDPLPLPWEE